MTSDVCMSLTWRCCAVPHLLMFVVRLELPSKMVASQLYCIDLSPFHQVLDMLVSYFEVSGEAKHWASHVLLV